MPEYTICYEKRKSRRRYRRDFAFTYFKITEIIHCMCKINIFKLFSSIFDIWKKIFYYKMLYFYFVLCRGFTIHT